MSVFLAASFAWTVLGIEQRPSVVVVVGAPGTPEYEAEFRRWASLWQTAAEKGNAAFTGMGWEPEAGTTDRDRLRTFLTSQPPTSAAPLWIILIGHGTDDGREARFNLRGPDVTARELADWLAPLKRPVAVINCASASGPFVNPLSGPGRVIVTATRSGSESNYARFGQYLAEAISNRAADLDGDQQVSLLEAFLTAAARTGEFYKAEGRLATEHPLIDDNGDKLGSPAEWFQGIRAVKRAQGGAAVDGTRAHQWHLIPSDHERSLPATVLRRRDELEMELATLRNQKDRLGEDDYYTRVEKIVMELARLYLPTERTR